MRDSVQQLVERWRTPDGASRLQAVLAAARNRESWLEALEGLPGRDEVEGGRDLRGATLAGAVLTGADLSGVDLACADLTGARLTRANLTGAHLDEAVLAGADLTEAVLARASLIRARLPGARAPRCDLSEAKLAESDLTGIDLSGAVLWRADLRGARLDGATLPQAQLLSADLTGARLSGAVLTEADLRWAQLPGADASRASLFTAQLAGANLAGANLAEADLSGADLAQASLVRANLFAARMTGAHAAEASLVDAYLCGADLSAADLANAYLEGAQLSRADLRSADLGGARCRGARFDGAILTGASLAGALLWDSDLTEARLDGANLEGADLAGARLQRADLAGANLSGANCQQTLWNQADLREAVLEGAHLHGSTIFFALGADRATANKVNVGPEIDRPLWRSWSDVIGQTMALFSVETPPRKAVAPEVETEIPVQAQSAETPRTDPQLRQGSVPGVGDVVAYGFRLVRPLGEGAMGLVWEAEDIRLARRVAIKMIRDRPAAGHQGLDRLFEREAKATARLSHPNIVTVFEGGSFRGAPYLVLELLEGRLLSERIARGPLPLDEGVTMMVQILRALAHAHGKGILHRDLKPHNIFVLDGSSVKVLDFGLAEFFGPDPSVPPATTGAGGRRPAGSPAYMAPEVWDGSHPTISTDLWAAAVTFFEMLTGRLPFERAEGFSRGVGRSPSARAFNPSLPEQVEQVLARALHRSPSSRFQTADEFVASIADLIAR